MLRVPQASGVLYRSTDAERQVQGRINDDTGRPDLTVVGNPPGIGDDAGRSHRRTDCLADRSELCETTVDRIVHARADHQARATTDDSRRLGQIHRRRVGRLDVDHCRVHHAGFEHKLHRRRDNHLGRAAFDATTTGLQRRHEGSRRAHLVLYPTTVRHDDGVTFGNLHCVGNERTADLGGQTGSEVAAVG